MAFIMKEVSPGAPDREDREPPRLGDGLNRRDLSAAMPYRTDDAGYQAPSGPDLWGPTIEAHRCRSAGLEGFLAGSADGRYADVSFVVGHTVASVSGRS
jgi:hypothetical protein